MRAKGFKGEVLDCLDESGMTSTAVSDLLKERHPELVGSWIVSATCTYLAHLVREGRVAVFKHEGERNLYAKASRQTESRTHR